MTLIEFVRLCKAAGVITTESVETEEGWAVKAVYDEMHKVARAKGETIEQSFIHMLDSLKKDVHPCP